MISRLLSVLPFFSPETLDQIKIILEKGGVMMIPLGICSFIALLIIVERLLSLRMNRLVSKKQFNAWKRWFDFEMSRMELPRRKSGSILGAILFSIEGHLPLPKERLEERLADLARKEKHRLERGLVFLDTIAGIAPLFGLLGTALGMVEVFSRLSAIGEAKISALSSGISEALFTTVTGLCIGIPALIAFNLFSRHIERILLITEDQLNVLIDDYYQLIVKN
ncbi:MotA/TolQ/ExbB proton channel family protein [bacterium]|nr:MotA/TolQ/ExbB proton channel family protein [bacterium]